MKKLPIPIFDGEKKSAKGWLPKLQTYFALCPMIEEKAIPLASLCLEGITYEWWHHGLITQGHNEISTFEEFSRRVLDRFEKKDVEEYCKELATLEQTTKVESYIEVF